MFVTLTAALLLGAPPPAPAAADAPPTRLQLFADDSWYKGQKGEEKSFTGVLSRAAEAPKGAVGFGRVNPYRLTMTDDKGQQSVREVYTGARPELLAPYVGHKVRLVGKAVDAEVEGKAHAEIWPARLELLDALPPPPLAAPPDHLDVLAGNKVYLADATPEKEYVGVLQKKKGEDAVGYQLLVDAGDHIDRQDVHLFDPHYDLFDPYDGMRVKIIGKKLSGQIRGVPQSYILPGRLEVLPAAAEKAPKELKILARAEWTAGPSVAPVSQVIRSPRELALAHGQPEDKATDASVQEREATLASRLFNVESIRWEHEMIVIASPGAEPTAGYHVDITGLVVLDDVLHVQWRVIPPAPAAPVKQEVTHPAQAVLAEHFDGKVVFDAPAPPPGK